VFYNTGVIETGWEMCTDKERTYIELVSLDDLGGRVVRIIVGLIVLVPFKAL